MKLTMLLQSFKQCKLGKCNETKHKQIKKKQKKTYSPISHHWAATKIRSAATTTTETQWLGPLVVGFWWVITETTWRCLVCSLVLWPPVLKTKKVKVPNGRSSPLPQKTLLLKCLVSRPALNSVTLWHHTVSPCHTFINVCQATKSGL